MSDTSGNIKDMNEDKKESQPSSPSTSAAEFSDATASWKSAPPPSQAEAALHTPQQSDPTFYERKLSVILALFKELDGMIASYTTGEISESQRRGVEEILREREKLNSSFVDLIETVPCAHLKSRYTKYVDQFDKRFNAAIDKKTLNPTSIVQVPSFTADLFPAPPGSNVDMEPFNDFMQRIQVFEGLPAESLRKNKTICNEIGAMQDGYMKALMESADLRAIDMTKDIRGRIRALLRAST